MLEIRHGTSFIAVIGSPGTGKTLLLDLVSRACADEGISVQLIPRGDLARLLFGARSDVLLVDESNSLTKSDLRILVAGRGKPYGSTIIFAGLRSSLFRLADEIRPVVVQLAPLNPGEARDFVLGWASSTGRPDLFEADALDRLISSDTDKSPRTLGSITELAAFFAKQEGGTHVRVQHVVMALSALAPAPAPPADRLAEPSVDEDEPLIRGMREGVEESKPLIPVLTESGDSAGARPRASTAHTEKFRERMAALAQSVVGFHWQNSAGTVGVSLALAVLLLPALIGLSWLSDNEQRHIATLSQMPVVARNTQSITSTPNGLIPVTNEPSILWVATAADVAKTAHNIQSTTLQWNTAIRSNGEVESITEDLNVFFPRSAIENIEIPPRVAPRDFQTYQRFVLDVVNGSRKTGSLSVRKRRDGKTTNAVQGTGVDQAQSSPAEEHEIILAEDVSASDAPDAVVQPSNLQMVALDELSAHGRDKSTSVEYVRGQTKTATGVVEVRSVAADEVTAVKDANATTEGAKETVLSANTAAAIMKHSKDAASAAVAAKETVVEAKGAKAATAAVKTTIAEAAIAKSAAADVGMVKATAASAKETVSTIAAVKETVADVGSVKEAAAIAKETVANVAAVKETVADVSAIKATTAIAKDTVTTVATIKEAVADAKAVKATADIIKTAKDSAGVMKSIKETTNMVKFR